MLFSLPKIRGVFFKLHPFYQAVDEPNRSGAIHHGFIKYLAILASEWKAGMFTEIVLFHKKKTHFQSGFENFTGLATEIFDPS